MKTPKVTARAHTNIALVKYWGKADEELIIPQNNSLSLTLDHFYTDTTVQFDPTLTALLNKSRRGEDKSKFIYLLQMAFQLFVCIHREAGCSNRNLAATFYCRFQIIPDNVRNIIKYLHHKNTSSNPLKFVTKSRH